MTISTMELSLKLSCDVPASSPCIRPPSWPPPVDWVVSLDRDGKPLSEWGHPEWDFSTWAGFSLKLHFTKTPRRRGTELGAANQHVLRMSTTWMVWGTNGVRACRTLVRLFSFVRRLVTHCQKNGIVASDLWRFPRVLEGLVDVFKGEGELTSLIAVLDRLYRAKDILGFALVDEAGLRRLSQLLSEADYKNSVQTPYIPPRIWTYQVKRIRECLDDFLAQSQSIKECFTFCVEAYAVNYGSLREAMESTQNRIGRNPFGSYTVKNGKRNGRANYGPFIETAKRFGIDGLLAKWVASPSGLVGLAQFSAYLSLIQHVGVTYIANFTLQRKEEFTALRADCLIWEEDPSLGKIPTICGETTKTDPDSDARWPTSPSVEVAVEALTIVARLRLMCALESTGAKCTAADEQNPALFSFAYEPWSGKQEIFNYSLRPAAIDYGSFTARFPRLFDIEELRITQQDLDTARLFTPNLDEKEGFAVGEIWALAYHQLRRTGAVNMFASGILSDSSIQVILKHVTVLQSRYYGKNFSRLRFNQEWEDTTIAARYEVAAKRMQSFNEERYVSPYGEDRKKEIVLKLIGEKDYRQLLKEGMQGNVSFRDIRLGVCTNRVHCPYGGIESISRCTGGDGDKPCREVLYDRNKRASAQRQLKIVEAKLNNVQGDGPRLRALQAEAQGLRSFLHDTE